MVHLYHLTAHRPDIMPFIALPFGYRFFIQGAESSAWHDQKIDK
ncbi:immunity protein Imm33 domain-containing protein [Metapseudomonas otitidis]